MTDSPTNTAAETNFCSPPVSKLPSLSADIIHPSFKLSVVTPRVERLYNKEKCANIFSKIVSKRGIDKLFLPKPVIKRFQLALRKRNILSKITKYFYVDNPMITGFHEG